MLCPIPSNIVFSEPEDPLPSILRRYPHFDPAEAANLRDRLCEALHRRYAPAAVRNFGALLSFSLTQEIRQQDGYYRSLRRDLAYSDEVVTTLAEHQAVYFIRDVMRRQALERFESLLPPGFRPIHRQVLAGERFEAIARALGVERSTLARRYYRVLDVAIDAFRAELGLAPLRPPLRFTPAQNQGTSSTCKAARLLMRHRAERKRA